MIGRTVSYGIVASLLATTTALCEPGAWTVSQTVSPLTGGETYSATLKSSQLLLNQIGQPEAAALVLRCSERTPAFYVKWPQVLSHDLNSILLHMPSTIVRKRIDDAKINLEFWVISSDGTGAGSFDRLGAPRMIASVAHAKRLVVRMTGSGSVAQDAVFDLDGIEIVAAQVSEKCGLPPVNGSTPAAAAVQTVPQASGNQSQGVAAAGLPWGPVAFAAPVQLKTAADKVDFNTIKSDLLGRGWTLTTDDSVGGRIVTSFRDANPGTDRLDCGMSQDIPYLMDTRTKSQISLEFTISENFTVYRTGVRGYLATGYGNPDRPLTCVPKKTLIDPPFELPSKAELDEASKSRKLTFGVLFLTFSPDLAKAIHREAVTGVYLQDVTPGSVAAKAGLRVGDIITAFDGVPTPTASSLLEAVKGVKPGKSVKVNVTEPNGPTEVIAQF